MDLNDAHNIAQICQGVGFIGLAMWLIFANNSKADFREKLASPATAIEKATDGRYELLTPAPHKQALDTHNESELLAWEIQEEKKMRVPEMEVHFGIRISPTPRWKFLGSSRARSGV